MIYDFSKGSLAAASTTRKGLSSHGRRERKEFFRAKTSFTSLGQSAGPKTLRISEAVCKQNMETRKVGDDIVTLFRTTPSWKCWFGSFLFDFCYFLNFVFSNFGRYRSQNSKMKNSINRKKTKKRPKSTFPRWRGSKKRCNVVADLERMQHFCKHIPRV